MRSRPLAVFALTAGLAVLIGDLTSAPAGAQEKAAKKARNKNKKNKNKVADQPLARIDPRERLAPTVKPPVATLPVPGSKDAAALAKVIDDAVNKKLGEAGLAASARTTDAEFLRRAYLDITGTIPPAAKARAFLDDRSPDKREELIDELLADPHFGRRMADIWAAKLFPRDSGNRFVLKEPLYKWLEEQFNKNAPWDKFVAGLVTATGTVADNPAVTYFLANRSVDKLTDTTAQHFLGIQLQCAQCHNHPFTSWKQSEYWAMASFYSKVSPDRPRNANKGGDNTAIGVKEGNGRTRLKDFFPESARGIAPKFLGGPYADVHAGEPYRPALAKWMTAPDNPFFARAFVNRTWAHFFGRGFVNPVDDMLVENEPSHPELLDSLAAHVATAGQFDLKYLVKAVCLSGAYQRTSKPAGNNRDDKKLFSHMAVKVMSPEQLYDSLTQVTGATRPAAKGAKGGKGPRVGAREQFVTFFLAGAEASNPLDYEAGIPQALRLMNSPVANSPAAARAVLGGARKPEEAVERIYLTALSRRPTAEETKELADYVGRVGAPAAHGDILWAVLNSSEFTLVR
jgi:hypothetical protein